MKGYLVDANVILRLLMEDDSSQTPPAKKFVEGVVAGETPAYTTVTTVLELAWTLDSFFQLRRSEITTKLELLLNTPDLLVENQEIVAYALDYFGTSNVDFADCYNAAFAVLRGDGSVASYDRHFDKLAGVKRYEP